MNISPHENVTFTGPGTATVADEIVYFGSPTDTISGSLFVTGTLSGSSLHAIDLLTSSGSLSVDGSANLDGAVTINDSSADADIAIESDSDQYNFFSNGGTNRIGIGTNEPETKLEVIGTASGLTLHASNLLTSSGTYALRYGSVELVSPNGKRRSFAISANTDAARGTALLTAQTAATANDTIMVWGSGYTI